MRDLPMKVRLCAKVELNHFGLCSITNAPLYACPTMLLLALSTYYLICSIVRLKY